jgi:restriction system-associated AAA family ATPase
MKLLRLKINSPFRGLPKEGIELLFRQDNYNSESLNEPICFVGLNGSGKSNVLEVICEIFYYLEILNITQKQEQKAIVKKYEKLGFEISYSISALKWNYATAKISALHSRQVNNDVVIDIAKAINGTLEIEAQIDKLDNPISLPLDFFADILPNKIIGYSSGQNELISNPFIKLDFHYFEEFQKRKSSKNISGSLDVNRMFYMDYESNQLVVLANYLFQENDSLTRKDKIDFNKKLRIEHLHSFSIKIQFRDHKKAFIELPSELYLGIENLKKCASTWTDNAQEIGHNPRLHKNRVVEMSFYTDAAIRKAFRNVFKTPTELFRILYLLRLLNIYCYTIAARKAIKEAPNRTNLNDLIPKPSADELVFKIDGILFKKANTTEPVSYKQLSDGEHQLLHVIGTLMLMKENDTLFILDEPETHFNPEWRAKMISLIMNNNKMNESQQDYFITSHSPFIISDCQPENVYIFNRKNGKLKVETAAQKKINTFGTSVNILTEEVFNQNESQGEYSLQVLNEIKNRKFKKPEDIQKAKQDARVLGDSVEKTLLFRKLLMLEDEMKKKKTTKTKKK